jgi:hypothetical protein
VVERDSGDVWVDGPGISLSWDHLRRGPASRDRAVAILRSHGWTATRDDAEGFDLRKDVPGGSVTGQLFWSSSMPDTMLLTAAADLADPCPEPPRAGAD